MVWFYVFLLAVWCTWMFVKFLPQIIMFVLMIAAGLFGLYVIVALFHLVSTSMAAVFSFVYENGRLILGVIAVIIGAFIANDLRYQKKAKEQQTRNRAATYANRVQIIANTVANGHDPSHWIGAFENYERHGHF